MKSVILTSEKNFAWMSMQEIIPYIENSWMNLNSDSHTIEKVEFVQSDLSNIVLKLLSADNIVCTCFTVEIVNLIIFLKEKMMLDFKVVFYVHGLASVALWPLLKWNLVDHLTSSDVFVVSCDGDKRLIDIALDNCTTLKHPFFISTEHYVNPKKTNDLLYIGRFSEQKNLYTLLEAIKFGESFMRDNNSKLHIVGGEDSLGSPNMGLQSDRYLEFILNYIKKFKIDDLVEVIGFLPRNEIENKYLAKDFIYVNISLHSDENFGVVPYQMLSSGHRCVLSDWAGFSDFRLYFTKNLSYVAPFFSKLGPYISPISVMDSIKGVIGHNVEKITLPSASEYLKEIEDCLKTKNNRIKVAPKEICYELLDKRNKYYNNEVKLKNNGSRVFDSYEDNNYLLLAQNYAQYEETPDFSSEKKYYLSDLVSVSDKIYVNDPHKGKRIFDVSKSGSVIQVFRFIGGQNTLCVEDAKKMYDYGYLFEVI